MHYQKGFTLIELLAVMIVFVVVGGILTGVIVSTLRGTNKTTTFAAVRSNGNYAMTTMTKMIRNAKRLQTPASCVAPGALTPTPFPAREIILESLDGGLTKLSCDGGMIASTSASAPFTSTLLTNPNAVKVTGGICEFTCTQATELDYPTIHIFFELSQARANALFDQQAIIPFTSTVTMRNRGD